MSKMAELDAAVAELRKCGDTLIRVSDTLRELFSSGEVQQSASQPKPTAKALTIDLTRQNAGHQHTDHTEGQKPAGAQCPA